MTSPHSEIKPFVLRLGGHDDSIHDDQDSNEHFERWMLHEPVQGTLCRQGPQPRLLPNKGAAESLAHPRVETLLAVWGGGQVGRP
jgi:hypothetical protein